MICRLHTSITTKTQWVLSDIDSQQNKSILHKLSFMEAIKDNHDGATSITRSGMVILHQHTSNDIFIDLDSKCIRDDECDTRTTITRIALFNLNNRFDQITIRDLLARLSISMRGEQSQILSANKRLMKLKQGRRLNYNG